MERKPTDFELPLAPGIAEQIDTWRRTQPGTPSRAEAARRLIELGLKAAEAGRFTQPQQPEMRSVRPEDEVRSGPEAVERPSTELDD